MEFRVVIPARLESTRFPKKVLHKIAGRPMIQHVYERAVRSGADAIVVATDHEDVVKCVERFDGVACMTAADHQSGTERLAEAVVALDYEDDMIVVCVQGDEPCISPQAITQVAQLLDEHQGVKMASLCVPITDGQELFNPNVVKVVLNARQHAIYFSRAPIPWHRQQFSSFVRDSIDQKTVAGPFYRHIGMYAYRVGFLRQYVEWEPSPLEEIESLEQLRVLWHGMRIYMGIAKQDCPPGVDVIDDVAVVEAYLKKTTGKKMK